MKDAAASLADSASLLHVVYADEMRTHAAALIWLGYRRLDPCAFAQSNEPAITGELLRHIKMVAQDPTSPEWVDYYEINEQQPQNVADKTGVDRPIMDIEVERHCRGPRPRIGFEAKRLGRSSGVSDYLGDEGLGRFLRRHYETTHGESGMLGYVQEHDGRFWETKLSGKLASDTSKYQVREGGQWRALSWPEDRPGFCSVHNDLNGDRLFVTHLLLPFHAAIPAG